MIGALTAPQKAALRSALAPFAARIEQVLLYGSRARGDHRPGSDVDLLLIGDIDLPALTAIAAAIEASDLSIEADLTLPPLPGSPLARVIAREAVILFERADLYGSQPFSK